jgi:hypothetical protein
VLSIAPAVAGTSSDAVVGTSAEATVREEN